jgi:hypothetical protein
MVSLAHSLRIQSPQKVISKPIVMCGMVDDNDAFRGWSRDGVRAWMEGPFSSWSKDHGA